MSCPDVPQSWQGRARLLLKWFLDGGRGICRVPQYGHGPDRPTLNDMPNITEQVTGRAINTLPVPGASKAVALNFFGLHWT